CLYLSTPVISANVSLYIESETGAVYPTPVVGLVGVLEDVRRHVTPGFKAAGDLVALAGGGPEDGLAGSEYLERFHNQVAGRPTIDLDLEKRLHTFTLAAIEAGLVRSAHDCSLGGLAVALAR